MTLASWLGEVIPERILTMETAKARRCDRSLRPLIHRPLSTSIIAFAAISGALSSCSEQDAVLETSKAAAPAAARDDEAVAREFRAIAERLYTGDNPILGHAEVDRLAARVAKGASRPVDDLEVRLLYVQSLLRVGRVDEATEQIDTALTIAKRFAALQARIVDVHRARALAYLRKAEVENCVRRHNADCCVFPLREGGVHTVTSPIEQAMQSYLRALKAKPDALDLAWLLNISAMALGRHPDGVPPRYLIPAGDPSSREGYGAIRRFVDVAAANGVAAFNLCGGCIAEDFDGDGVLDVLTTTSDPKEHAILYRGLGGLAFADGSRDSGLEGQLGGLNCVGADYDSDGDVDALVLRGAWMQDDGQIRNSLLRNEGGGRFVDVTHAAGLADAARPTQAACFADFDDDGDLDVYVGNEYRPDATGRYPSELFVQVDPGRFEERAAAAGVTNDRYAKGVCVGDYDNDGDVDLYVSNVGRNRLYKNDGRKDGPGGLSFTDVAEELGVAEPAGRSFACWFFDMDNDGWLDLFVTGFRATLADVAADHLGRPHGAEPPRLYRNREGRFEDVARDVGLDHAWLPMGANFGDLDNDGWLDVFLGTGDPEYETLVPNVMLRNVGGERFVDVTTAGGFGHLQKGHGIAFADFDEDGDQDLYLQLGGFYPGDRFANALLQNPGHGNHWLKVRLVGATSNRSAIGARMVVEIEGEDGEVRRVHRAVGAVSSFGGSPLRQEIGLGAARAVRSLEVTWPTSRTRQRFTDVPLDTSLIVIEGEDSFERVVPRGRRRN